MDKNAGEGSRHKKERMRLTNRPADVNCEQKTQTAVMSRRDTSDRGNGDSGNINQREGWESPRFGWMRSKTAAMQSLVGSASGRTHFRTLVAPGDYREREKYRGGETLRDPMWTRTSRSQAWEQATGPSYSRAKSEERSVRSKGKTSERISQGRAKSGERALYSRPKSGERTSHGRDKSGERLSKRREKEWEKATQSYENNEEREALRYWPTGSPRDRRRVYIEHGGNVVPPQYYAAQNCPQHCNTPYRYRPIPPSTQYRLDPHRQHNYVAQASDSKPSHNDLKQSCSDTKQSRSDTKQSRNDTKQTCSPIPKYFSGPTNLVNNSYRYGSETSLSGPGQNPHPVDYTPQFSSLTSIPLNRESHPYYGSSPSVYCPREGLPDEAPAVSTPEVPATVGAGGNSVLNGLEHLRNKLRWRWTKKQKDSLTKRRILPHLALRGQWSLPGIKRGASEEPRDKMNQEPAISTTIRGTNDPKLHADKESTWQRAQEVASEDMGAAGVRDDKAESDEECSEAVERRVSEEVKEVIKVCEKLRIGGSYVLLGDIAKHAGTRKVSSFEDISFQKRKKILSLWKSLYSANMLTFKYFLRLQKESICKKLDLTMMMTSIPPPPRPTVTGSYLTSLSPPPSSSSPSQLYATGFLQDYHQLSNSLQSKKQNGASVRLLLRRIGSLLDWPEEAAVILMDHEATLLDNLTRDQILLDITKDITSTSDINSDIVDTGDIAINSDVASMGDNVKRNSDMAVDMTKTSDNTTPKPSPGHLGHIVVHSYLVSEWTTQTVVSQTNNSHKQAVFYSLLRLSHSSLNIGNFNGAYQVLQGLRSSALSSLCSGVEEYMNWLDRQLRGAAYKSALARGLAMPKITPIPALLPLILEVVNVLAASPCLLFVNLAKVQWVARYLGEDGFVQRCGPGGLHNKSITKSINNILNTIDILHRKALMNSEHSSVSVSSPKASDSISSVSTISSVSPMLTDKARCISLMAPSEYVPVQPLTVNPGVSLVPLHGATMDFSMLQIGHHGCSVIHLDPETQQSSRVFLKLETCNGTLTWCQRSEQQNQMDKLSPGLKLKYINTTGENIAYLDEGYIDLSTVKNVDSSLSELQGVPPGSVSMSLVYGTSLPVSKFCVFVIPPKMGHIWVSLLRELKAQIGQDCLKMRWLKEQFLFLFFQDDLCMGPLPADAIKVFGGRNWSISGMMKENKGSWKSTPVSKVKKKSYGNIHSIKDRGIHEINETFSPINSPKLHRKSFINNANVTRSSLLVSEPIAEEGLNKASCLRTGSITHGSELSFQDFLDLFKSFSLRLRKDIRNIFNEQAVCARLCRQNSQKYAKGNEVPVKNRGAMLNSLTRNSSLDLVDFKARADKKKIYDAMATASILNNSAGSDTSRDKIIPLDAFLNFLDHFQKEDIGEDGAKRLIELHEPDPVLRDEHVLSFEGFARYLMDTNNSALTSEESDVMDNPLAHYFIATSHNTYLTSHQLKGTSSVEIYRQILLSGCRCVELDCWDGDDGNPIIYHGHTLTTKISFKDVVHIINESAFVNSPFPVILSLENHCSIPQQQKMADIFKTVFGDKLVMAPYKEAETALPSPNQLKYKIVLKNKKIDRTSGSSHAAGTVETNVVYNDDEYDSDFEEEIIDDEVESEISVMTAEEFHRTMRSKQPRPSTIEPPAFRHELMDKKPASAKKPKTIHIAQELSDLIIYCQSIKFKRFKDNETVIDAPPTPMRKRNMYGSLENSPSGSVTSLTHLGLRGDKGPWQPMYKCSSIHEARAKSIGRKHPGRMLEHTETQLVRCYPTGMRIDSSNFNPVTMWSVGIQMAALNYQTSDTNMALHKAFFSQNNGCGYILKPSVMWSPSHILHRRFNPASKDLEGLHSMFIELTIISGQYVCQQDYTASPVVEVEVVGIPKDCFKSKTKMCQRNALNPIWEDTFEIEIRLIELAFLRFTIVDIATNMATAQRVIPLKQLRAGYRNLSLHNQQDQELPLSSLFICSQFHRDSTPRHQEDGLPSLEALQRKRMSFLVVHDISETAPYAILKVTNDSTTQDIIKQALEKSGRISKSNEFVLIEEVMKEDGEVQDVTHRMVGMNEIPLNLRSQWNTEGKFLLKRIGSDPTWRARLGTSMMDQERKVSTYCRTPADSFELSEEDESEGDNNFLVCVFNVCPGVAHTILQVPKTSSASDVIAQALLKARRNDQPEDFILIEESEVMDPKKKSKKTYQRCLDDDENVFLVQSGWKETGKLTMLEREKGKLRFRGLDKHANVRETQSDPVGRTHNRRSSNIVNRVRRFSRSIYGSDILDSLDSPSGRIDTYRARGAVSDGDISEEDEEESGLQKTRKVSIANFNKLKIW